MWTRERKGGKTRASTESPDEAQQHRAAYGALSFVGHGHVEAGMTQSGVDKTSPTAFFERSSAVPRRDSAATRRRDNIVLADHAVHAGESPRDADAIR
jgi:hypothetical protein